MDYFLDKFVLAAVCFHTLNHYTFALLFLDLSNESFFYKTPI